MGVYEWIGQSVDLCVCVCVCVCMTECGWMGQCLAVMHVLL